MVRVREVAKQHLSRFLAEQTAISLLRPDMPADSELLKVAIIGAPNAGKSTFVNRLMGWRVSLRNK
jgi:predicted GTPase